MTAKSTSPKQPAPAAKPRAPKPGAKSAQRRQISDPEVMKAVSHPTRVAVLELILREGPLTATQAAELLDESPGTMSWHLQMLAKHGFVEEAEGGRGRSRPWQLVHAGSTTDDDAEETNGETAAAVGVMAEVAVDRRADRFHEWIRTRHSATPEWRRSWFNNGALLYLTPEELHTMAEDLVAVFERYRERTVDPTLRPEGSRPVALTAFGHPLPQTPSGN